MSQSSFFVIKKNDILSQIQQERPSQTSAVAAFGDTTLPKNIVLLSLRQDHFNHSTIKFLGLTVPFFYLKKVIFSVNFSNNNPHRHLRWLFS